MGEMRVQGHFNQAKGFVHINLALISFKENDVTIIYSPALDLSGYGNTVDEAKRSFEINLEEFIRYTTNKGSFFAELEKYGWKISKRKKSYTSPHLDDLLRTNDYLSDIIRDKEFQRYNQNVRLPAYA